MTSAPPATRGGLLRMRDFRLLWAGETTSMLGSSVAAVALPLVAVVTLDAGTFTVGLLTRGPPGRRGWWPGCPPARGWTGCRSGR
ncbi:hypothetical protein [Nonomuraea rubra]|uniref:hypothetical protein n=1 Tax=Nonomuraea rubra TaxID=46180 RepID=UPI0031E5D835